MHLDVLPVMPEAILQMLDLQLVPRVQQGHTQTPLVYLIALCVILVNIHLLVL